MTDLPAQPKQIQARGAEYVPIHGKREVKIYPIQEHELKTIGICNSQVSLWCSVASAALALIASCVWDMATSDDAAKSKYSVPFMVGCAIVAAVSFFVAKYYWTEKKNEIEQIKSETNQ